MIRTGLGVAIAIAGILPASAQDLSDCYRGRVVTEVQRNRRQICIAAKSGSDLPCSFILGDRDTRLTCVAIATKDADACAGIQDTSKRETCIGYADRNAFKARESR